MIVDAAPRVVSLLPMGETSMMNSSKKESRATLAEWLGQEEEVDEK